MQTSAQYIERIKRGENLQPLVMGRADIEKAMRAVFGQDFIYEELAEFAHPNFTFIVPAGEGLNVAEARNVVARASFTSSDGGQQVIVIDRFDQAGNEASNALLKTLEDVPQGMIFLLQAGSYEGFLETILSRVALVSSDISSIEVSSEMRELARGLALGVSGGRSFEASIGKYYSFKAFDRTMALGLLIAMKEELAMRLGSAKVAEQVVIGGLLEVVATAMYNIASTNATPKYQVDVVVMGITWANSGYQN